MAADLYIHIIPDGLEQDVATFLLCDASTVDSAGKIVDIQTFWVDADGNEFPFWELPEDVEPVGVKEIQHEFDRDTVMSTDSVWIGEVSWLKADLLSSPEEFIPSTVGAVAGLLPGIVEITEDWVEKIGQCFDLPNTTGDQVADREYVVGFLRQHIGQKAYQISH